MQNQNMPTLKTAKSLKKPAMIMGFTVIAVLAITVYAMLFAPPRTMGMSEEDKAELLKLKNERAALEVEKENKSLIASQEIAEIENEMKLIEQKASEIRKKYNVLPTVEASEVVSTGNFKASGGGLDNFLKVNGAEFVKEAGDIFRAAGLLYKIKPEVMVCIAQADSSLGNALKSTNNIGNVGNNDRGDVKHYDTLGLAIAGIGDTLNNQYMKGNTMIGQLSGGGRHRLGTKYDCNNAISPYKCYATSPVRDDLIIDGKKDGNWNKNVRFCLRDILGDQSIDETFNFRTQ